jgi:hypothetical protein
VCPILALDEEDPIEILWREASVIESAPAYFISGLRFTTPDVPHALSLRNADDCSPIPDDQGTLARPVWRHRPG